MVNIIIATIKSWNIANAEAFRRRHRNRYRVFLITDKKDFTRKSIQKINPRYIFFPHWSWVISDEICKNFECVVFHMTDVPFGRGGSPLQNLVKRGIRKTKISALKVERRLDAGPVYLKRSLSLHGSAEDIYRRASQIVFSDMIPHLLKYKPMPHPQQGKVVIFERLRPEESNIPANIDLEGIYDYIRMLDAEGYPHAFLEVQRLRLESKDTKKRHNSV